MKSEKSFHDDMVHMMGALSYYDDDDTIGSHSVSLRSISKRLPTSLGDDTIAWLVLKEDMFSYFNHFTDTFSMQTQGSIEVWMNSSCTISELDFDLNDSNNSIMRFEEVDSSNVNVSINKKDNVASGSIYSCRVIFPEATQDNTGNQKCNITSYKCSSRGPISPVHLKLKVRNAGQYFRVAIKIAANMKSKCLSSLKEFVIVLSIPLELEIDSVTTPLPQGEWNELRRIITWRVPFLPDENVMELLTQLKIKNDTFRRSIDFDALEFPTMVTCIGHLNEVPSGIALKLVELKPNVSVNISCQFQFTHRIK